MVSLHRTVAEMLGISEDEYRKGVFSAFSRAEEYLPAVVSGYSLPSLRSPTPANLVVTKWLEVEFR